ncbi:mannosyl-3-phosphoglycerate phosphatase-related protein [Maricurvus nonylphenolicus]|uniref:HAD-IIB family hydrolase n=1 Tax=Maricurvus nonylphenolicus TaxID=1008307 RepID=UPI0036F2B9EE
MVNNAVPWIVFTDLDGTLLDHHSYSYEAALPAIKYLQEQQIPIVLTTSKTQAEVSQLQQELQLSSPFIVENGAGIYWPCTTGGEHVAHSMCSPREHWLALLEQLKPEFGQHFSHFAELNPKDVVELTGLSLADAEKANQRAYGEPIHWYGDQSLKRSFIEKATSLGAHILEGGRFLHMSGNVDKGQALQWVAKRYQQHYSKPVQTLALGDSQNDIAMLNAADKAVIVRSPVHPPPELQRPPSLITQYLGPEGWFEAINYFIADSSIPN